MRQARPRKISKSDEALLDRAVAAGCECARDKDGRIVALFTKRVRMSAADCKRLSELSAESDAELVANGGEIWETPNPANLIGGSRYYMLKPMSAESKAEAIRDSRFTHAASRVANLKRHPELTDTAERLARSLPDEEGKFSTDPFWHDLAYAEMLAVAYDAAPRVIRDNKRQSGTKRGGVRAGRAAKTKAAAWQEECAKAARELLQCGRSPRELAGILSQRFHVTPRQVCNALKLQGSLKKTEIS